MFCKNAVVRIITKFTKKKENDKNSLFSKTANFRTVILSKKAQS